MDEDTSSDEIHFFRFLRFLHINDDCFGRLELGCRPGVALWPLTRSRRTFPVHQPDADTTSGAAHALNARLTWSSADARGAIFMN